MIVFLLYSLSPSQSNFFFIGSGFTDFTTLHDNLGLNVFASSTTGLDIVCGKYRYCFLIIYMGYFGFPVSTP